MAEQEGMGRAGGVGEGGGGGGVGGEGGAILDLLQLRQMPHRKRLCTNVVLQPGNFTHFAGITMQIIHIAQVIFLWQALCK